MTDFELLIKKIDEISYPSTMTKISGEIKRSAFFPGGKGTLDKSENISEKEIIKSVMF